MHVEKNVYDNVIETFFNIKEKTKDEVKAQQDLVDMGISSKLHLQSIEKWFTCLHWNRNEKNI